MTKQIPWNDCVPFFQRGQSSFCFYNLRGNRGHLNTRSSLDLEAYSETQTVEREAALQSSASRTDVLHLALIGDALINKISHYRRAAFRISEVPGEVCDLTSPCCLLELLALRLVAGHIEFRSKAASSNTELNIIMCAPCIFWYSTLILMGICWQLQTWTRNRRLLYQLSLCCGS